jgi:hypothetical protein
MASADLLTTIRSELEARLAELRPLLEEHEQLVAAAEALDAQDAAGTAQPSDSDVEEATPGPATADSPPSTPKRGRRQGLRGSAAGVIERAASGAADRRAGAGARRKAARAIPTPDAPKRARALRGAAEQAILAALEHGSHTAGELVTVTAMGSPNIRGSLSRLAKLGTITKTKREGKTAYALSSTAAEASAAQSSDA